MEKILQCLKPQQPIPRTHYNLHDLSEGTILSKEGYATLYKIAEESEFPYFSRVNERGETEFILVYGGIDEFSQDQEAKVEIEFSAQDSLWIGMLWIHRTEEDEIGYPYLFETRDLFLRAQAIGLLEQGQVNIHYLAWENGHLFFLCTEGISYANDMENATQSFLFAYQNIDDFFLDGEVLPESTINGQNISREKLHEEGLSIYLDYQSLEKRWGMDQVKEKIMTRVYRGIHHLHRYLIENKEEKKEFLLWIGEREGRNKQGELTRMMVLTLTPGFYEEEDHPFLPLFMFLPEFEKVKVEAPHLPGNVPIIAYDDGCLFFIEWDEE